MKREKYLNNIPTHMQATFKKAFRGKSRSSAVTAKCLDCSGFNRNEAVLCTVESCPLYPYRPGQRVKNLSRKTLTTEQIEAFKKRLKDSLAKKKDLVK